MAGRIDLRLAELGIDVPEAAVPVANYVAFTISGNTVHVAGQLPMENGKVKYVGLVGNEVTVDDGAAAAQLCALNIIAQIKAACGGDLDRVVQILKLNGFVNAPEGFADQPAVINGASNLMVEVFGEAGKHARSAVGMGSLPFNASVEIDAIVEIS
jgi:enamine deaminase RidA (YjgF/YER057c/UK114 family)